MSLLILQDLCVSIWNVPVLQKVSFRIGSGERVGMIGESGCGKSLSVLAVMGLLPEGAAATGSLLFEGRDMLAISEREWCRVRGARISVIVQEPMTALSPLMRIGDQIAETVRVHDRNISRKAARGRAVELLGRMELIEPERTARAYPHQLSGGQRQRVMIAMAIACGPALILADEPTTALDVTVQARMLELLARVVEEEGSSLLLVSHDIAVVASVCERLIVLYGGRVVEEGPCDAVLSRPLHPYTAGLVATSAALSVDGDVEGRVRPELPMIPGAVPSIGAFPPGCPFRYRCRNESDRCLVGPSLTADEHAVACWHPETGESWKSGHIEAKRV